jgi:hypothetical protein
LGRIVWIARERERHDLGEIVGPVAVRVVGFNGTELVIGALKRLAVRVNLRYFRVAHAAGVDSTAVGHRILCHEGIEII